MREIDSENSDDNTVDDCINLELHVDKADKADDENEEQMEKRRQRQHLPFQSDLHQSTLIVDGV